MRAAMLWLLPALAAQGQTVRVWEKHEIVLEGWSITWKGDTDGSSSP